MTAEVTIRSAIGSDAGRISALLTGLAEEFIVPAFAAEGRNQLLAEFAAAKIAQRLDSADYRFHVAESGDQIAGVVAMRGPAQERNGVQFQPMGWAADPADAR